MSSPINLDAGVVRGSFAEALAPPQRSAQAYATQHDQFSRAPPGQHAALPGRPALVPPVVRTPRYFGGFVLADAHLPAAVLRRVKDLAQRYVLTRALGNGDCGYNAFLGCLLHAIAARSPDGIAVVESGFAALTPHRWRLRITSDVSFMDKAQQGHRQLLALLRALRTSAVSLRRCIIADFCASPAFAHTVTYLRGCTAQRQLAGAAGNDLQAVTLHVGEHTLVAGQHASWFEMQALAEALNVDLFVANPRESDQFCVSTRPQGWATVTLLCWAEDRFHSGHFDGLLPR